MMATHDISRLDDAIVYGILNEKLRLECDGIEALSAHMDLDQNELEERMNNMGCYYDPLSNQFRFK